MISKKFTESQSELSSTFYKTYLRTLGVMPHKRTLDIGCGWGFMSEYFEGYYLGLDLSDEKIKFARRLYGPKFEVQNILDGKLLEKEKFEQITLFTVLDEIDFKHKALLKILNILEDSGELYIEVRNADFAIRSLLKALGLESYRSARNLRLGKNESDLDSVQYANLFDSCGFEVIKQYKASRPLVSSSFIQLCKKFIYLFLDKFVPNHRCFMLGFVLRKKSPSL